jgi:hypothetical protein
VTTGCVVGLYRTSRPVRKSGKFSKSGLSGNWTFSLPDARPLRPLDARNLQILCMVFMTVQIMSGTQKLSQNNTPEPFNRVLVAIFDP